MPALQSSVREPVGRPCGYIIPKYVNTVGANQNKNFLRGYYFAGDGRQELYGHALGHAGFWAANCGTRCDRISHTLSAFMRRASACRGTKTYVDARSRK